MTGVCAVRYIGCARCALPVRDRNYFLCIWNSILRCLAWLLAEDGQADAAEEAIARATSFTSDEPTKPEYHHILGYISLSRGEMGAAITHHETALGTATSLNSREALSSIIRCLAHLLLKEGRFDDPKFTLNSSSRTRQMI